MPRKAEVRCARDEVPLRPGRETYFTLRRLRRQRRGTIFQSCPFS
jgi:hypothetical protein